ncbi:hypothetical protein FHW36_104123 [Chitinophaga polysaccharea]|uniref:Uncharacterized protein n=1 Tax=Chitinophaga polysaccharea TaxID=1293035 RepID=A0A561PQT8_9BACT|nr:hypothetical protein [Chitinophaga polysaccharea]TWF40441.1 hypothetical protein FHW36_104123 [Chitinophaga polysaccharea]
MTLDQLRTDLLDRFTAALDESDRICEKKKAIVMTVYSDGNRYDISRYRDGVIPAHGALLTEPPETNPYTYGLDADGRPCYSRAEHTWNKVYWEGFYHFSDAAIEYIEFELSSMKPVKLIRLLLENGRKKGFQFLQLNGLTLGRQYEGLSPREIAEQLPTNEICSLSLYHYENNRITHADCWSSFPGSGPENHQEIYTYNSSGELEEINAVDKDLKRRPIFVTSSELTIEELADQLAAQIGQVIGDTLSQVAFDSPLAIVQLNYREISSYHPYLMVVTVEEQEEILKESSYREDLLVDLFISPANHIPTLPDSYERLFVAFMNRVKDTNNYYAATRMIRKVANILTTEKLYGKVPVSPGFIAFSVDWSMTPDNNELAEIMLECGMSTETLANWQQKGIFVQDNV